MTSLRQRIRYRRGYALVLVIWLLGLMSLFAVSFLDAMRTDAQVAANAIDDIRTRATLEAGLHRGIAALVAEPGAMGLRLDGTPWPLSFDGAVVTVALQAESGKIDLNAAQPNLLRRLLISAGVDVSRADMLVDRILDWRDQDDPRRPLGAEVDAYLDAGRTVGPANRALHSIDELRRVLGMTSAPFSQLRSAVTVYSGVATPVQAVAPQLVLMALNEYDAAAVDALLQTRSTALTVPATGNQQNTRVVTVRSVIADGPQSGMALEAVVWFPPTGEAAYRIVSWQLLRDFARSANAQ